MAHIPATTVDASSTTVDDWSTAEVASFGFNVREWAAYLTEDTDGPVGICFGGKTESHIILDPTQMPFIRWKATAENIGVLRLGGTTAKVVVMGSDEVV